MERGGVIRFGTHVAVVDPSQVAVARRTVSECAEAARLSSAAVSRAALVATELATNLVKHGGGGSIFVGLNEEGPGTMLLAAVDAGPGIANVDAALRDGFSTAGSPGTGLGAISRSAHLIDIYSFAGKGTALLCRIDDDERLAPPVTMPPPRIRVAGICLPKSGEPEPGDSWIALRKADGLTLAVADGLGHGEAAATASLAAIHVVRDEAGTALESMIRSAHARLRSTRGAAVMIASIDAGAGRLDAVGVGNVAGVVVDEEKGRRLISHNGIVGHEMRKLQPFSISWTPSSILIMSSDGLSTNWSLEQYPGLAGRDAAMIAAVIHRDHCRGNDDSTIVVVKAS